MEKKPTKNDGLVTENKSKETDIDYKAEYTKLLAKFNKLFVMYSDLFNKYLGE